VKGEEKGIPRDTIHHEGRDEFKGTEPRQIISIGGGHDVIQHDRASKCTGQYGKESVNCAEEELLGASNDSCRMSPEYVILHRELQRDDESINLYI
jgi:hypothetical protein